MRIERSIRSLGFVQFVQFVVLLQFTVGAEPATTRPVGTRTQLLVDDWVIAEKDGVKRVQGTVRKENNGRPVLVLDRPWETATAPIIGSVLFDRGKYRAWYRGGGSGPRGGIWCYAESTDGLAWTKPSLGLVSFNGSNRNNIFVRGQPQCFMAFIDPNERDSQRRYKSAINTVRIDTGLAYSPDGLRWTPYAGGRAITGRASDTISQVIWDGFDRVYRLYTRTDFGKGGEDGEIRGTRDMVAAADADLADPASWKTVREWCLGHERGDKTYHRRRQVYSLNGSVHEGIQFALIWTLEHPGGEELMECFLATTRGRKPWNLEFVYADRPLIPRGREGAFDCRWVQPAINIVTREDRHWLYYVGLARSHAGKLSPKLDGPAGGIGLATLRRDRFVGLAAGGRSGTVTTHPFRFDGSALELNIDALRGEVLVEVLDRDKTPYPGFSRAEAIAGRSVDSLRWRPGWKRKRNLETLRGKTVRLRVTLKNARWFAFQVVGRP